MRSTRPVLLLAVLLLASCNPFHKDKPRPPAPGGSAGGSDVLPVTKAAEEVIVAAWAEPARLPPGGGQSQILVRLQKRGGAPYPDVEVRLHASGGSLFSQGRVLKSDASGRTRDRLTSRGDTRITVNAGGTVYRFAVPAGPSE